MMMLRFCRRRLGLMLRSLGLNTLSTATASPLVDRWSVSVAGSSRRVDKCLGWMWTIWILLGSLISASRCRSRRSLKGREVGIPSATCQRRLVTQRSSWSLSAAHSRCTVPVLGRSIWRWSTCRSLRQGLRLVSHGRNSFSTLSMLLGYGQRCL